MPDLPNIILDDIKSRLQGFLKSCSGYTGAEYVGSGGSAAIFRVSTPVGDRAIKVYDPQFFSGSNAQAERKRLALQRSLIGHGCAPLVSIYKITEAEGTAFIEMEFVKWQQLKKVLPNVPDDKISGLIQQLVQAIMFLEKLDLVHRDVKPENIHISDDFLKLKLIDLGVVRALSSPDEEADATDHGLRRPFIATAQYSSPEYLFRLDTPSPALWKALNLYQVGGVLHDLINKKPLFHEEVEVGNRFVVAKAVLTKTPTFPDKDPHRLAAPKALAARCLVKDMATRLQIVSWTDFAFEAPTNSLSALASRLNKGRKGLVGSQATASVDARIEFERERFSKRFCDTIRNELIAASDNIVQVTMMPGPGGANAGYVFDLSIGPDATVMVTVGFLWLEDIYSSTAKVCISACLNCEASGDPARPHSREIAMVTIGASEDVVALDVANRIAQALWCALDMLEAADDKSSVHGADLGAACLRVE